MNQLAKWGARRGFCSSLAVAGGVEGRGQIRGEGASLGKVPFWRRLRAGGGMRSEEKKRKKVAAVQVWAGAQRALNPQRVRYVWTQTGRAAVSSHLGGPCLEPAPVGWEDWQAILGA